MDKVVTDAAKPDWDLIWILLINLTDKVTKITVRKSIKEFNPDGGFKLKIGNIKPIHNITTVEKLTDLRDQAALDAFMKKPYDFNPIRMEELIFWLGKLIFGTDIVGHNKFYWLKRLMRNYKVNWSRGIRGWASQ